jgi:hypothetical protein
MSENLPIGTGTIQKLLDYLPHRCFLKGVKTHVYMIHILTSSSTSAEAEAAAAEEGHSRRTFQCTLCHPERSFANEEALFQHNRSRHSQTTAAPLPQSNPNPISEEIKDETEKIQESEFSECSICGIPLSTSLDAHLQEIIPPDPLSLQCSTCQKIFHTERSLQQHLNFCQKEDS